LYRGGIISGVVIDPVGKTLREYITASPLPFAGPNAKDLQTLPDAWLDIVAPIVRVMTGIPDVPVMDVPIPADDLTLIDEEADTN
jgi:hypothetical protein